MLAILSHYDLKDDDNSRVDVIVHLLAKDRGPKNNEKKALYTSDKKALPNRIKFVYKASKKTGDLTCL